MKKGIKKGIKKEVEKAQPGLSKSELANAWCPDENKTPCEQGSSIKYFISFTLTSKSRLFGWVGGYVAQGSTMELRQEPIDHIVDIRKIEERIEEQHSARTHREYMCIINNFIRM